MALRLDTLLTVGKPSRLAFQQIDNLVGERHLGIKSFLDCQTS
jgi:hypothetical protein